MGPSAIAANASVVIVGGGLSGALCALHILAARPDLRVSIVERGERLGPGLAYGTCSAHHLLNVPVSRLDVKASTSFEAWLTRHSELHAEMADALAESGGRIGDAFVPRRFFGAYIEKQVDDLLESGSLAWKRGEAISFLDQPGRGILLADGREIAADAVILALGNLPPKSPSFAGSALEDLRGYIPDPWAPNALSKIAPDDSVLLIGTGLTAVDVVISLRAQGHTSGIFALSRRGLLPSRHAFGGQWPPFLATNERIPPSRLLKVVRDEIAQARQAGVAWQRVIDSIRPFIARIWGSWSLAERRSFLRHLRPRWDIVRHRMAPRIATEIEDLIADGGLKILSGRIAGCRRSGAEILIDVSGKERARQAVSARHVINCTGPRTDFATMGAPLIVDARRKGLIRPDPLGLGLETDGCAVVSAEGASSAWLFAVGPLTRPAWWEITAAPEITAQVLDLAVSLTAAPEPSSLADRFLDLGAGI